MLNNKIKTVLLFFNALLGELKILKPLLDVGKYHPFLFDEYIGKIYNRVCR